MRSCVRLMALLLVIGAALTLGYGLNAIPPQAGSGNGSSAAASFPKDIYSQTGNRLPAVNRDSLDEAAKKIYDASRAGTDYGPGRLRLYGGGEVVSLSSGLNDFLRRKAGLEPQVVELSILATMREMDGQYVWTVHEPEALKAGVSPEVVDIVKYRKPLTGIGEKEATVIELGREAVGQHKVSSETFARARKQFGDRQLVDIICLMGDYVALAVLLNTFDQHVPPTDKPLLPIP
jgi:4-carboxymuconolactone decarboxylase